MAENGYAAVPLLGRQMQARVGAQLGALPRKLDEAGTLTGIVESAGGQARISAPRAAYVDAEELVEMIRQMIREELAAPKE